MSASADAYRKNVIISILMICIGYAFYNIGDAAMKIIAAKFHFSQIIFMSSVFTIFFMGAYGWIKDGPKSFRTKRPGLLLVRAALAQVVALCNIYAFPKVELATFYTLIFTAPFWISLFSALFLKDRLGPHRLGVILFGFAVVLCISRPGGELFNVWSFLVLLSALTYAAQMVLIRYIGTGESRPFMFIWGSLMSMTLALPFLVTGHVLWPTPYEWGLFFIIALTGCIGLLCVSYAFQAAPSASSVAPYHYTQIVWGVLLGYFLFHEVPRLETMVGSALIIIAGLYLIHTETRKSALKSLAAAEV